MYDDINAAMTMKLQSGASKSVQNSGNVPDKQSDTTDKLKSDTRKKL